MGTSLHCAFVWVFYKKLNLLSWVFSKFLFSQFWKLILWFFFFFFLYFFLNSLLFLSLILSESPTKCVLYFLNILSLLFFYIFVLLTGKFPQLYHPMFKMYTSLKIFGYSTYNFQEYFNILYFLFVFAWEVSAKKLFGKSVWVCCLSASLWADVEGPYILVGNPQVWTVLICSCGYIFQRKLFQSA